MPKRVAKLITNTDDVDMLLNIKEEDITATFIYECFGLFDGKRKFNPYDIIDIPVGAYVLSNGKKNKKRFTTTVGLWIMNIFLFQKELSHVIGYYNKTIGKNAYRAINQDLSYAAIEDKITVKQFKNYLMKTQFLMQFVSVVSPNQSEELLTCTRKINKKKNELIKKYKKELDAGDVIIAEKVEKELLDYAIELLGDDPALDTFLSGARGSIGNNFKNMYVMKGAVRNVDPDAKKEYTIATSNYMDGVSREEYSLYANSLAAGPYSRGKKTQSGGYWEKLFVYAFQHLKLGSPNSDCKTTNYIEIELTKKNISKYMYSYIITNNGLVELTSDNKDKYIEKKVKMRFSSMCKRVEGGCFCNKCAGNYAYRMGTFNDIGITFAQIPSTLKNIAMKAFHDSTVSTVEMDPMVAFGLKNE